jgi:hypothetical protein
LFWAVLLAFSIVSISGCGDNLPKRVSVSGHVFIDGKPLEKGTMFIESPGQRPSYATLGPGGKFSISTFSENDGIMPGKHKIAVLGKEDITIHSVKWYAPRKYADISTSGLEIEVTGPNNDVKIDLTSEPGQKLPFIEKT